jgi:hypothetical protein
MLDLLLKKGANANLADHMGRTPMFFAVAHGRLEVGRRLLAHGADPAIADKHGNTPLHFAASRCHVEFMCILVQDGGLEHVNAVREVGYRGGYRTLALTDPVGGSGSAEKHLRVDPPVRGHLSLQLQEPGRAVQDGPVPAEVRQHQREGYRTPAGG